MTLLFREDPYQVEADAVVLAAGHDGIRLDRTLFYPSGGGQPGDTGILTWEGGSTPIIDTRKADPLVEHGEQVLHIPDSAAVLPPVGARVMQKIDWARRHRHMRMHTALHLVCAVVPGAVTGGQVGADRSRLDFDVPSASLDKEEIETALNELIAADHPVRERTITDADLEAMPELVRTMSVKPPMGSGSVRLLQIGTDDAIIDLQPCGGTHVVATGEIGPVTIVKIENKGKQNRRVQLALRD
ncbi:alanyl-tRNA editing protein [Niveispirillum fermenti]|uniref:alanyl-tRNA editing protein n=1 Tax=Niveispirillum fermenti TaxID=1233113 RepID=UPI003A848352